MNHHQESLWMDSSSITGKQQQPESIQRCSTDSFFLFFNAFVDILIMYHYSDSYSLSDYSDIIQTHSNYRISLLICPICCQVTVLNPRRTYEISHLKPNVSYDFKIQCFNIAGTSDFSPIYKKSVAGKVVVVYCM